jgi:hypothetical protein
MKVFIRKADDADHSFDDFYYGKSNEIPAEIENGDDHITVQFEDTLIAISKEVFSGIGL